MVVISLLMAFLCRGDVKGGGGTCRGGRCSVLVCAKQGLFDHGSRQRERCSSVVGFHDGIDLAEGVVVSRG